MAGGSQDNFFAKVIGKGASDAAKDLGVDLQLYWSSWNTETMQIQFKEAIDSHPDGIAVMGHPGSQKMAPFVAEALRKGILVTSLNVDMPELEAQYQSDGFGYIGQDVNMSGHRLASQAITRFHIGSKTLVGVIGVKNIPRRGQRTLGILDELMAKGIHVEYVDCSSESANVPALYEKLKGVLSRPPNWKVIIDDVNTDVFIQAYSDSNSTPDQFKCAVFDMSPNVMSALKNGIVDLALDQQPYIQGYFAVLQLCLSKYYAISGLHIYTDASFLEKESISNIEELVKAGIR